MRDFEYFIVSDELQVDQSGSRAFWGGVIYCRGGIEIHVSRLQEVDRRSSPVMVRTVRYSYHVLRRDGSRVTQLFRYDNVGEHGIPNRHHRHQFDANGVESSVQASNWPTLGEVIEEAAKLWEASPAESEGANEL
jgi:hypothetical protein